MRVTFSELSVCAGYILADPSQDRVPKRVQHANPVCAILCLQTYPAPYSHSVSFAKTPCC